MPLKHACEICFVQAINFCSGQTNATLFEILRKGNTLQTRHSWPGFLVIQADKAKRERIPNQPLGTLLFVCRSSNRISTSMALHVEIKIVIYNKGQTKCFNKPFKVWSIMLQANQFYNFYYYKFLQSHCCQLTRCYVRKKLSCNWNI